jgi:TusA-related sulfurtransferase
MRDPDRRSDVVEDARGLLCPIPVIKLAERVAKVPLGATVLLLADDAAAEEDVRLWCRGQGQELVRAEREGSLARIWVRRRR